jgi:hypothetical protein
MQTRITPTAAWKNERFFVPGPIIPITSIIPNISVRKTGFEKQSLIFILFTSM